MQEKSLVVRGAVVPAQEWMSSQAQLAVIRRDIAPGLDNNEFEVFLGVCRVTGFNPILKQIYAIRRNDKRSPSGYKVCYQTGIDGLRLQAHRSGVYAGSDEPIYEEDAQGNPTKATVTIYKVVGGLRCPFIGTARWREYCPPASCDELWRKMPHVMLAKCAEALALRKAFPAELSGLYVHEEMQQADLPTIDVQAEPVNAPPAGPAMPKRKSETAPAPEPEGSSAPTPEELRKINEREAKESSGRDFAKPGWRQTQVEKCGDRNQKGGRPWSFYFAGGWHGTFDAADAEILTDAQAMGYAIWVRVVKKTGKNGREYSNIEEVFRP